MKIYIPKCQLERSKFNSSDLHLITNTATNCLGQREVVNNTSTMVLSSALSSGACGNIATANQTHITYSNTLHISPSKSLLITRSNFKVNFSCTYPLKTSIALNSTLNPVIGLVIIDVPGLHGNGKFTVTMQAFTNEDFTGPVTDQTPLKVEDNIYISVIIYDLDANNFALKVTGIFASPTPDSTTQYDLLKNGCPATGDAEGLVSVRQNGNSAEARFAMKVFKITNSDFVNLSANVTICNGTCVQDCSLRSLASEYSSAGSAIITLPL
uniref:ZP domain-containing protein n=1 Tax=Leptobrachium leishanense TaxID=445787 RepID=A0A8C5QSF8_9ANUR